MSAVRAKAVTAQINKLCAELRPDALAIVEGLPTVAGSPWLLTVGGGAPYSNFGHAKAVIEKSPGG